MNDPFVKVLIARANLSYDQKIKNANHYVRKTKVKKTKKFDESERILLLNYAEADLHVEDEADLLRVRNGLGEQIMESLTPDLDWSREVGRPRRPRGFYRKYALSIMQELGMSQSSRLEQKVLFFYSMLDKVRPGEPKKKTDFLMALGRDLGAVPAPTWYRVYRRLKD